MNFGMFPAVTQMSDGGEKVILESLFAEVGNEHAGEHDDVVDYDVRVGSDDVAGFVPL